MLFKYPYQYYKYIGTTQGRYSIVFKSGNFTSCYNQGYDCKDEFDFFKLIRDPEQIVYCYKPHVIQRAWRRYLVKNK